MIGSGWRIYNDEPLFGFLFFSETFSLGGDPIKSLQLHGNAGYVGAEQWHFFGMWILALNGLAYLSRGSHQFDRGARGHSEAKLTIFGFAFAIGAYIEFERLIAITQPS
jgi:thiosulfate reductase cytochrome b subunit